MFVACIVYRIQQLTPCACRSRIEDYINLTRYTYKGVSRLVRGFGDQMFAIGRRDRSAPDVFLNRAMGVSCFVSILAFLAIDKV